MRRNRRYERGPNFVAKVVGWATLGQTLVDLMLLGCMWVWMPDWQARLWVVVAVAVSFAAMCACLWVCLWVAG